MEKYYTDIEGAEGPHTREQLAALVERGILRTASLVVREGDTEWRAASEVVPALFAPGRGPRGRRWAKWAALGSAAAVAAGLVAGVVVWAPWSGGGLVDPEFLRAALPSDVTRLQYSPRLNDHEASEDLPDLDAASMAVFCGGRDIAGKLIAAEGKSLQELAADGVFEIFHSEAVRQELQCGRSTAAGADPGWLMLDAGEQERSLFAWHGTEASLIGARSHSFSGLDGVCLPGEAGSADCGPGRALVGHGGWWVFGAADHVAAFARDWVREERTETTNMEIVRRLSAAMSPQMESRVVVKPDRLGLLLRGACFRSAPTLALGGCFPSGLDDSVQRIQSLTRGFGWQRHPMVEGDELRHEYLFLARDESDAESLSTEIDAVTRDWRAHLENQEAQAITSLRERGADDADFREAQLRAFVRAVKESEVSVDGEIVRWQLATDLVDSEARVAAERRGQLRARYEAIGRIVRALEAGEDPARDELVTVVGTEAADLIQMPHASEAQCQQIADRMAAIESAGVGPEEFGAKFRQAERFATEACVGMLMPQALLSCLLEAQTFSAMEGCKSPSLGVAL